MNRRAAIHFFTAAVVTFAVDVRPLLDTHCLECHSYGADLDFSMFPFNGPTTDQAKVVTRMLARISLSTPAQMPPGNRPKLTSNEIEILRAWQTAGLKP